MGKKTKVHSLTGRITFPLLLAAFKAVKQNRGAAGVDRRSIAMFEANLGQNLEALMRDMKTRGRFQPKPLRRVRIPKGPGSKETRPLGIPVVRDRVAQEVLRQLQAPVFEPGFHDDSYGFRPGRNCHMAIRRAMDLHGQGYRHVLDADIKGFFDNIPHKAIMELVAREVADGNILGMLQRFLTAGVMEDGVFNPTTVGTPQGGVLSPCWRTSSSTNWTGRWKRPDTASCGTPTTSSCSAPPPSGRKRRGPSCKACWTAWGSN